MLWILPAITQAGEISLAMPGNLKALADYHSGDPDKPAVLVLHGFLQTHNFSTVRLIATELADAGYAVLSPTLTLNIDQRKNSLACDAVQNHTVEHATKEIATWVAWLKQHGHAHIVLIGHSTGSNNLLSYLHSGPDSAVSALIATSVGPMQSGDDHKESDRQQAEARRQLASGDSVLKRYTLGFCRENYVTPPGHFLSYMQWDRERLLDYLRSSPVPTTVVLGESDKWSPEGWRETLEQTDIPLRVIAEANHYFSGTSEFSFQSTILSLVESADDRAG
ncbi:MAG: alpha/beta hydrolase [Gammaproteobacteria bacterium]|nr:alpha/beta hydrolase [Gammaproteobacteria bacterium]